MPVFSASKSTSALIAPNASTAVTTIDTRLLESLVGYNARRAFLAIMTYLPSGWLCTTCL